MPEFKETVTLSRTIECKRCGSTNLWKNGEHKGVQYYLCKDCGYRGNGSPTFPHGKHDKITVVEALTYYYKGMSFRNVQKTFNELSDFNVSTSTLWDWIIKYTNLVIPYVRNLKPKNIGNSWFADETMIKMHGKNKWLWAIIDEDTRYLLACNFTTQRTTKDAEKLFYEAYRFAGVKPFVLSTDKLPAYMKAFRRVFYTRFGKEHSFHVKSQGFRSPTNTNLIERWHEYIKQRSKIMRNFKTPKSAYTILQGIIINYNFLWNHSSLDYQPPFKVAGIDTNARGVNSWRDLIELAIKYRREVPNPEVDWFWSEEMRKIPGEDNAMGDI